MSPWQPRSACTLAGCWRKATTGARCELHQRRQDQPRPDGWVYADRRYKIWRGAVLNRDPVCRRCGKRPSTTADHVVPIVDGGEPFDVDNGQGLDELCHGVKTREDRARRRHRRLAGASGGGGRV